MLILRHIGNRSTTITCQILKSCCEKAVTERSVLINGNIKSDFLHMLETPLKDSESSVFGKKGGKKSIL